MQTADGGLQSASAREVGHPNGTAALRACLSLLARREARPGGRPLEPRAREPCCRPVSLALTRWKEREDEAGYQSRRQGRLVGWALFAVSWSPPVSLVRLQVSLFQSLYWDCRYLSLLLASLQACTALHCTASVGIMSCSAPEGDAITDVGWPCPALPRPCHPVARTVGWRQQ